MSYTNYQKRWTDADFAAYVKTITLSWADSVTIHHTYYPDLSMRPNGLTLKHQQYLMEYYRDTKGWSAGPHLFVDDIAVLGMSPMHERGVHARSFNSHSIGIEMLGNYDQEDPFSGRGAKVYLRTAKAVASILSAMGRDPDDDGAILFHRDDPRTSKTCPGMKIEKGRFITLVRSCMNPSPDTSLPLSLDERILRIEKHLGLE